MTFVKMKDYYFCTRGLKIRPDKAIFPLIKLKNVACNWHHSTEKLESTQAENQSRIFGSTKAGTEKSELM